MSTAYTTSALVLRRWPVGESALIVRFLTPHEGLLSGQVSGAQKPTGSLHFLGNPFTLADIEVVPTRGMSRIVQAASLTTFPALQSELPRLQAAALVLEVAEQCSTEGLGNPSLFLLTLEALRAIEQRDTDDLDSGLLGFIWGVLDGLGASPILDRCIRTGGSEAGDFVVPLVHEGGFACAEAAYSFPPHARIPVEVLHLLHGVDIAMAEAEELPPLSEWPPEGQRIALAVLLHFVQASLSIDLKTARPYMHHSPVVDSQRPPTEYDS